MSPATWIASLSAIAPVFIDAALRGAVVLLLALALTYALRRRTAAARHLVWVGAIVVQLALPLFALWGPQWRLAVPNSFAVMSPVALPTTTTDGVRPSLRGAPQESTSPSATESAAGPAAERPRNIAGEAAPARGNAVDGRTILLALWLLGALVILARLAIGTSIVAALARRGARVDDGSWLALAQRTSTALQIDRPLTLLRGDTLGVPVTWGIVYPVVLLPNDADSWPEERRRFVLVHEMAHVKRLDALTQLAGQLALALFWFDPLVWMANRRMQLEREHACDDYVLRHGTAPSQYAEELLAMVRALGTPDHRTAQPAFAALAMARRSEFEGRMLSILDPVLDRHPLSKGRTLLGALGALLLVVPLAALHPYQRAAASPEAYEKTPAASAARAKSAEDDLPASFKVSINAVGADTAGLARTMKPLVDTLNGKWTQLATGMTALGAKITAKSPNCDTIRFGSGTSTSTHIHSDDSESGSSIIDYTKYNGEKCSSATIIGKLTYSETEDDVISMPFGAHATFRERHAGGDDRALSISRAENGAIVHSYRRNGETAPYDDDARRWFASYLPTMLMEAGINVGPRVARWRAQGGVDNVLTRIGTMSSSGSKRSHYEALMDAERLSNNDLDGIVRHAGRNLSSSGDLRAVLEKAAPTRGSGIRSGSALEEAIGNMGSSGDKTAVLEAYGQTTDKAMLMSVMRVARTIQSSGDKAGLLQELAQRYLSGADRELYSAFYHTALTIPSSGDLRNTLEMAIPYTAQSPAQTLLLIDAARSLASSGDRSDVLISLVQTGAVKSKEARDAFFAVAATVPSEGDRSRVLQAAARP